MALQKRSDPGDGYEVRVVSPFYARLGPKPSAAMREAEGDEQVARRIRRDWEAWRSEYGDAWDAGVAGTPVPPHHASAGRGYAR